MIENAAIYASERIAPHSLKFVYKILNGIVSLLEKRFLESKEEPSLDLIKLLRFIPPNTENLNDFIQNLIKRAKNPMDVKGLLKVQTYLFAQSSFSLHENISTLLEYSKTPCYFNVCMNCLEKYARFHVNQFHVFLDLLHVFIQHQDPFMKAQVIHVLYYASKENGILENLVENTSIPMDVLIESLLGFSAYGTHSEYPLLDLVRAEYKCLVLALNVMRVPSLSFFGNKWMDSALIHDACHSYLNRIENRFDKSCMPAHESKMVCFLCIK